MPIYRVRLLADNPWHPEYGTAEVMVRMPGFDLDDAIRKIRSIHVSADGSYVTTSWHMTVREKPAVGPDGFSFPCWIIVTAPRAVIEEKPAYLVRHVKPVRTIAEIGR